MFRKLIIGLIFSVGALSSSQATVSFLIDGDLLKTSSGAPMNANGLYLLVSSTTNANFESIIAGSSTAVGSLLSGDDKVIYRGNLTAYGDGVLTASTGGLALDSGLLTGWTSGDPLALLWFPNLTTASTTIPAGTQYGLYTNANAVDGSGAWITPTDPTTNYKLLFYTKDGVDLSPGASASNAPSAGNASLTVGAVPEPSRAILAFAGLAVMFFRRRRR